jgi:putative ATP-dependent endonuclease of OLD family
MSINSTDCRRPIMYISQVHIENFRCFRECTIEFNPNLTVIVGANNIGKTNLLAALSLIFSPDASNSSRQLSEDDIWMGWKDDGKLPRVKVQVTLAGMETDAELGLVAKWLENSADELRARITYEFRPVTEPEILPTALPVDTYGWVIYGGEIEREPIDYHNLTQVRLELLHALRDAEREMSRGGHRKLSRLIARYKPDGFDDTPDDGTQTDKTRVEDALVLLNQCLESAEPVAASQTAVNRRLTEVSGSSNAQSIAFRPAPLGFDDLIRNLQVLIQNRSGQNLGRVELNGLGYNNLLYVSVLLTDFFKRRALSGPQGLTLPVVAIEEPEAHLHPHLQKILTRYFAAGGDGQVIVTTHSTHVSSSVDPSHIVVLHQEAPGVVRGVKVGKLFTGTSSLTRQLNALRKYLDATRSTLFFANSVMLVEGLAEAIVFPVIAEHCLGFNVDDKHISIVAVQGTGFRPFANLFGPDAIQRRCAIVTDADPDAGCFPLSENEPGYEPAARVTILQAEMEEAKAGYVRVFPNLKTLEHDLIVHGNRPLVEEALRRAVDLSEKITDPKVATACGVPSADLRGFSRAVLDAVGSAKGAFAQALAGVISERSTEFVVPDYIQDAFEFCVGSNS